MGNKNFDEQGRLLEEWDDTSHTYTRYDPETGEAIEEREYNESEMENATRLLLDSTAAEEEERLRQQLKDGIAMIIAAREMAESDILNVDNTLLPNVQTFLASNATKIAQITAFTPGAVYTASDLVAVKNAVIAVRNDLKTIADAITGMYNYRKAIDQNAIKTDNALLWLAKVVSGDILRDEGN